MSGLIGKISSRNKIINEPLTDGGVLLGSGVDAITATAALADGEILIGDGTTDPVALDVGSSSSITVLGTVATGTWKATDVAVAHGGTGASTLTANYALLGNGTSAPQMIAPSTSGNVLTSNGSTWASTAITHPTPIDFEEGEWTPSWVLGSGVVVIATGYNELGYTKIGSMVFCSGRIENSTASFSKPSAGATCRLATLPVTPEAISGTDSGGAYWGGGCMNPYGLDAMTGNANISMVISGTNDYAQLYEATTTAHAQMGDHLTTTTALIFNFWYRASTT